MNPLLASVEQRAKESSFSKNNDPYLMIKPLGEDLKGKLFTINYWSICAGEGNDIKSGTVLESRGDLSFISKEAVLITNTVGGMNKQNNKARILAYSLL
jgi:hypothetical protein